MLQTKPIQEYLTGRIKARGPKDEILLPLPFYLTSVKENSGRNEAEHRTGTQEIPLTNVKGQKKDLPEKYSIGNIFRKGTPGTEDKFEKSKGAGVQS